MRISNSTITMSAVRNYSAEAKESQITINRLRNGDNVEKTTARVTTAQISQFEVQGSSAIFQTSGDGIDRTDTHELDHQYTDSEDTTQKNKPKALKPQAMSITNRLSMPGRVSWIDDYLKEANKKIDMLKRLLECLNGNSGKNKRERDRINVRNTAAANSSFNVSASMASIRYKENMAMLSTQGSAGDGQMAVLSSGTSGNVNGHWTRQTVQSGFIAGEEHTAFASSGTVVTNDGRTINFGISLEMSRSFEAEYMYASKEEIFTDPLVINLDTDAASLSDVSFYFDLDSDGIAEEISALDSASGFLALDKNGDGEINDGSELFGARTGDGFGELAQYDQDGNGWIDENDEIFSKLSVWVKCGTGESKLISLSEADVGAIFLGSQSTQFSLDNSYGETGAMIRKTGVYLKESGQAGTIQHVDFKG